MTGIGLGSLGPWCLLILLPSCRTFVGLPFATNGLNLFLFPLTLAESIVIAIPTRVGVAKCLPHFVKKILCLQCRHRINSDV
jgi:hypothetical protein